MSTNLSKQPDVWEKWEWLWKAIFYATVLISFVLMLRDGNRSASVWIASLLTGLMLLWHGGGFWLAYKNPAAWNERTIPRFFLIIGDIILWFVLVNISVAYYVALFGLFSQVFRHLPIRYAAIAAFFLTVATIFEQVAGAGEAFTLTNPTIWLFFFMGLATILLGIWVWAIIDQSTRRRQLIEKLEATQAALVASERREGVLEERQRLAREIHDTLAQGFTSIVLNLEAAEQAIPDDLNRLQKHLDWARSTARSSLDQARRVVQDLRPESLENQSLPDAISRAAGRWIEETGIAVTTKITGSPVPIHPNIEVALLRAAQEALNNIRKHAQAADVQLTLSYMSDVVILDIQDDGVGLGGGEPSPFSGGYGIQAMRERVAQFDGFVTLESDPGEGTTVVIAIPLKDSSESRGYHSDQAQE